MTADAPLSLFEACGLEMEYMIVQDVSLSVAPISDQVLRDATGEPTSEIDCGDVSWSNELALHVIELKSTEPATGLETWPDRFQQQVALVNARLAALGARLMPTAMHPWMDPHSEMRLWPHDGSAVYEAFHRVFDCRGHGWANLQSVHLNLPFADDAEFGRLHAAVRLLLPLLPALAASSPIMDGRLTGLMDNRLDVYRTNCARIKSVTGDVIPEAAYTRAEYERQVFAPMYQEIAPYDPEGVLQHEWLNARGAIARFDRQAIEIRVLDVQECPLADLAIAAAVCEALRAMVDERWSDVRSQQQMPGRPLIELLQATTRDADRAVIADETYLAHLGLAGRGPIAVGEAWRQILGSVGMLDIDPWRKPLELILSRGPLARRIVRGLNGDMSPEKIHFVYGQLCDSLATGTLFDGG
ncbi:MAG: glutamate--cysteine ligase [Planctomycetia bacterium]|nr:glutamate--cysteine ligase [Planctomycetia bacterium]